MTLEGIKTKQVSPLAKFVTQVTTVTVRIQQQNQSAPEGFTVLLEQKGAINSHALLEPTEVELVCKHKLTAHHAVTGTSANTLAQLK